jgi:anaerobic magnesium-protoporphyrin IX monomethyl ester cyclase
MKIFISNPSFGENFVRSARWAARSRGRVQRHPDYLLIAAAVLENNGHEVKFLDSAALNIGLEATLLAAKEFGPELAVIHTTTPSIYNDVEHAERFKDLGSTTVLIGQHASALPEDTIRLSSKIDFIIRGEYDCTLADLADKKDPATIDGITYREGDAIRSTKDRKYLENLDLLPFPAWRHIDIHDYFDAGKMFPFITLITGRGCPNSCSFCVLPQVMYGKKYRLRSPKIVVDEIESDLKQFPDIKEVMFEDDALTVDINRCKEICREIIARGINKKICWLGNSRADIADEELFSLMKESGCRMLVVGFEFGDEQILRNVHKRVTPQQMKTFIRITKKAGINVHGCFMVGGPGDTKETAKKTILLARELKPDTLQFSALTPYPGTEFYNWCKKNNFIVAKDWPEWVDAGEQSTVVSYPDFTREEIVDTVDKALYDNFYFRPEIWVHHLLTIRGTDDLKRKISGAKSLVGYWWTRKRKGKNQDNKKNY